MPTYLGDIVQTTPLWRSVQDERQNDLPEMECQGIVVNESEAGDGIMAADVLFINAEGEQSLNEWGNNAVGNAHYLEVVHELHTAEARAIHEAYPQHQGHDYYWYCEQRGVEPFRTPLELEQLANGDHDWEPDLLPEVMEQREQDLEPEQVDAMLEEQAQADVDYEEAVSVPLPWQQWLPGDIIRRHANTQPWRMAGQEQVVVSTPNYGGELHVSMEGEDVTGYWNQQYFDFVRRPSILTALVIATAPAASRPLQLGDRVQLVGIPGANFTGEVWNGQQGILTAFHEQTNGPATITRDNGSTQHHYLSNMELVTALLVEDLRAVPASDWQPGDTLRRVSINSRHAYGDLLAIGEEVTVREASEYAPAIEGDYVRVHGTREHQGNSRMLISDMVLVRRAGTPAPVLPLTADGLPQPTDLGARVLVNYPGNTNHGKAGSIVRSSGGYANYLVHVDGNSNAATFTAAQLRPLLHEPAMPLYRDNTCGNVWLDLDGASQADCDAFIAELARYGITSRSNAGNGFGSTAEGPSNNPQGLRVGLYLQGKNAYYYCRQVYVLAASLLRDWNHLLRDVRAANTPRYPAPGVPAVPVVPVKNHGLAKLPHYFILEGGTRHPAAHEGVQAWLLSHGFTGFTGHYSLFAGNTVLGTNLPGAAAAFQAKHQCVRLDSTADRVLISTLFTQRKTMLTTQAAQQRFALDVEASGPHLIVAFKAFMASIGYRQQNTAKDRGPYILLNGGNLFANQPATWQYSDVKNNRNALLDLSEPQRDSTGAKSGWEKLGERLANRNIARPVLDAEDLDRAPIAGDKVCLVFNDVRDDYPETDADLRSHTCGQQYTVSRMTAGLCQLTETGMLLHADRLQVLETPRGLQNGDQVQMSANYGEHLVTDQVLTLMNGTLVAADNTAYAVPFNLYTAVTPVLLTQNLLRRYGIKLPCVVKVINPCMFDDGDELVLSTAWPLNNQELAFWTEDTADKDSWLTRADFQVVVATSVPDLFQPAWRVLKGATRETTVVQVGELQISLAQLEDALSA